MIKYKNNKYRLHKKKKKYIKNYKILICKKNYFYLK